MVNNTITATIQMRKGLEADFDPDQMTAGEWAVSTDKRYVRMCFAPGICLRMATYESFEEDMKEIQTILATCQDIQTAVERFESLAKQHSSDSYIYSVQSKSWAIGGTGARTGEDADNSKYYSEESARQAQIAKTYAENASAVTGIGIATQTTAGIIKGGDNYIAEDGTLQLTKQTTDTTLSNSYAGGIKVNEIDGKSIQERPELWTYGDVTPSDSPTIVIENIHAGNYMLNGEYDNLMQIYSFTMSVTVTYKSGIAEGFGYSYKSFTGQAFTFTEEVDSLSLAFSSSYTEKLTNISFKCVDEQNPDYPQEILSVGGSSINMFNIDGEDYIAGYYPDMNGGFSVSGTGNNAYIVKVEPNTTYSISRKMYNDISTMRINAYAEYPTISSVGTELVNVDGTVLNYIFNTLEDTQYIAFYCNQTGTNQGVRLANIMINKGNIPLPYTPYGVTTVIRTHGNNLCEGRLRQGNSSNITINSSVTSAYGIPCKVGDVFSVSCKGMKVALILLSNNAYINPEGTIQTSGCIEDNATMECQYNGFVKIQFRKTDGSILTPVEVQNMEIMWNKGEVMPYEPYQESVVYLSETLRGIGNVKDRIIRKDGVWQIERLCGIDQNLSFLKQSGYTQGDSELFGSTLSQSALSTWKENSGALCTKLPYKNVLNVNESGFYIVGKILYVRIKDVSQVEDITSLIADAEYVYKLANPTYEPLPESAQSALHSLESYDTVTYISCDSEVEPTIDVEYGTSRVGGYTLEAWNTAKRNEINNAQLNSAILSLGGNV